ncbi:MAG: ABC transporter permease subunit [Planctomycetes bacterium]|nr:ABC transporter permease subunit [Planctomycetota bacterium]
MLKSIIRKEILINFFSYKFSIIIILSTILILASIFVMYRDYCLALENYNILQPKSNEAIAIIQPTPLSIFAKGLDENLCRSYEVISAGQIRVGSKQQSVNNLFRLFTTPDLLYIVKVIMSLCIMLFAFDIVSGEKETGTLRQSLSNNVKRPILIIGKWIGGFTSFLVPFFMAVLLGTILVTLSLMIQMNGQNWAKLALFLLSSVIYLALFFSLGLLISCLTHHSSSSLVISLFVWAMLVFLIPNLGNILARQLVEIPTVQQLEEKRSHIWIKETVELGKGTIDRKTRQELINSQNDKLIADYRNRFDRFVALSQNITRFSPAATYTYLTTNLMGTGILDERKLKRAILQYKDLIRDNPSDSDGNLIGNFTPFAYQRSSIKETLSLGGLSNLAILIFFNMLFFVSAYAAFLRYDVR